MERKESHASQFSRKSTIQHGKVTKKKKNSQNIYVEKKLDKGKHKADSKFYKDQGLKF